jgi:hypothetical protein
VEEVACFAGDLEVFAGRDDQAAHRCPGGGDVLLAMGIVVVVVVDGDAEVAEPLGGSAPDLGGVLADAAGEHERIHTAGRSAHGGDTGEKAVGVDVEGQSGVRLAAKRGGFDLAHVAGAGESE